jgi:hypothetical protein
LTYDPAATDVWEYFQQKETEIRERCGYVPDDAVFEQDAGPDGQSGVLRVRIWLADDAYLDVYEAVEIIDGSHVHRRACAYALIIDGIHEHGWERDPTHPEMPLHDTTERIGKGSPAIESRLPRRWRKPGSGSIRGSWRLGSLSRSIASSDPMPAQAGVGPHQALERWDMRGIVLRLMKPIEGHRAEAESLLEAE